MHLFTFTILAVVISLTICVTQTNSMIHPNNPPGRCRVSNTFPSHSPSYWNPTSTHHRYYVSTNLQLMQPNFVRFTQPYIDEGSSISECQQFFNDSRGINTIHQDDLVIDGYVIVPLAPSIGFGNDSCYIPNTVLMTYSFYNNIWLRLGKFVRTHFADYNVYYGCEYTDYTLAGNKTGRQIPIADGCYYVVTDDIINGNIMDYGYFIQSRQQIAGSIKMRKLPSWVICTDFGDDSDSDSDSEAAIIGISVVSISLGLIMLAVLIAVTMALFMTVKYIRKIKKIESPVNDLPMKSVNFI
jgi:hypothetical protein